LLLVPLPLGFFGKSIGFIHESGTVGILFSARRDCSTGTPGERSGRFGSTTRQTAPWRS
jgi:hypothetical protein